MTRVIARKVAKTLKKQSVRSGPARSRTSRASRSSPAAASATAIRSPACGPKAAYTRRSRGSDSASRPWLTLSVAIATARVPSACGDPCRAIRAAACR